MRSRENNFNLLRLLFAFLVIVSHSPELLDGDRKRELLTGVFGTYSFGEFAVNSFFILSGYLITASWLATPQWQVFIRKRLLRIIPGFAVAAAISLLLVGPLSSPTYWDQFQPLRFFAQLPFLIFDLPGFFANKYAKVNGALWTIHYEFVCYLLAGLLGVRHLIARPRLIAALFAASMAIYIGVLVVQDHSRLFDAGLAKMILVRVERYSRFTGFFLAGVYFHLLRERILFRPGWLLFAIAAFALLMCNAYTAPLAMAIPWVYLLFSAGLAHFPPAKNFDRVDLSYGLYLYAWPIQQLLIQMKFTDEPWMLTAMTTCAGLLAAAASWYLVEKPALRFKTQMAAERRRWAEGRDAA